MPKTKGRTTKKPAKKPKAAPRRRSPTPRSPATRAREPLTDDEIGAATESEARGLVCMRALTEGWEALVPRLMRVWGCTEGALSTYRRLGKMALAALGDEDAAARLDHVLAELRVQASEHEALGKDYRARGRYTLATKHDDLARKSLALFAEFAGLVQRRTVVSIEADPRIAGMYQAILASLEDFDRLRAAFLGDVEKLTGGTLPASSLPSAFEHVRAAVKRYEGEIGARANARIAA